MQFVVVTKWFTGLGFAMRLQVEGHDVELAIAGIDDQRQQARYALVGNGLVPKRTLAEVMAQRAAMRGSTWAMRATSSVSAWSQSFQPSRFASSSAMPAAPLPYSRSMVMIRTFFRPAILQGGMQK